MLLALFFRRDNCGTHAILLTYPVLRNYLKGKILSQQFRIKLIENKMPVKSVADLVVRREGLGYNPSQVDVHKLNLIDYEFLMSFFENLIDIIHLGKLLHIRGWGLCLFDIAFIGKSAFFAGRKLFMGMLTFIEYKDFVMCMNNSLSTKVFGEEKEICPICQEYMEKGVQLKCSHTYHQFCIVQFIRKGGSNCPICRTEIRY
jgi:hypothetical protein